MYLRGKEDVSMRGIESEVIFPIRCQLPLQEVETNKFFRGGERIRRRVYESEVIFGIRYILSPPSGGYGDESKSSALIISS